MKKRFKKLTSIILSSLIIFGIIAPGISAATATSVGQASATYSGYTTSTAWIYVDGEIGFCIDPPVDFPVNYQYAESVYDNNGIYNILYYGYPYNGSSEKDYVDTVPAKESAFGSLAATFKNGEFRKFVASDIFYWIALTMFQTGLPFFVTSLLKLPETMTTLYFVGMTALSLVFYIPVNKLTPKLGKKKMILFAFAVFSLAYFYTGFMGKMSFIPASVQGLILTVVAALPMAIFGILPQAVVADISQSDSITSGSNREGMFYAARTFAFKLGQSISMLIFTAVSTIGAAEGTGYRVAAFGAAVFCCIGGIILVFYNEKKINGIINRHQ